MTAQPPWATPVPWNNQDITLYHGTLARYADSIVKNGVSLQYARGRRDFGRGFYTTTLKRAAEAWANNLIAGTADVAAVVEFIVPRDVLARLDCLWFIRGQFDADDFWSFVFHCRTEQPGHGRAVKGGWYDTVVGPVTAFWQQRMTFSDYDQISFHTDDAVNELNKATRREVKLTSSSRESSTLTPPMGIRTLYLDK